MSKVDEMIAQIKRDALKAAKKHGGSLGDLAKLADATAADVKTVIGLGEAAIGLCQSLADAARKGHAHLKENEEIVVRPVKVTKPDWKDTVRKRPSGSAGNDRSVNGGNGGNGANGSNK